MRNKFQWNINQNGFIFIQKIHLKISSAKCRPFCLGLNVLNHFHIWWESPRPSCDYSYQIWSWYSRGNQALTTLKNWENIGTEKIDLQQSWVRMHKTTRRVIGRSREVSQQRDFMLNSQYGSAIGQRPRQNCCRVGCKGSEQSHKNESIISPLLYSLCSPNLGQEQQYQRILWYTILAHAGDLFS